MTPAPPLILSIKRKYSVFSIGSTGLVLTLVCPTTCGWCKREAEEVGIGAEGAWCATSAASTGRRTRIKAERGGSPGTGGRGCSCAGCGCGTSFARRNAPTLLMSIFSNLEGDAVSDLRMLLKEKGGVGDMEEEEDEEEDDDTDDGDDCVGDV